MAWGVALVPLRGRTVAGLAALVVIATFCYAVRLSAIHNGTPLSLSSPSRLQNSRLALNKTLLDRFGNRRVRVQRECQARPDVYYRRKVVSNPENFLLDDVHHLLFCFIPKNGCSFWKRVFAIIDGSLQGKSVFNLSSTGIHRRAKAFDTLAIGNKSLISMYHHLQSSKKAFFVRDPYERLFSGYIDKLFCPCIFQKVSKTIQNHFRNSWETETHCQRGINFTEFLQYVTNERSIPVNNHFRRQYTACHPCHIDYDFIGKLETFHEDADVILQAVHLNPSKVFGPEETFEENSDMNIMKDVVSRTWSGCGDNSCVPRYNMLLRLWIVFQVRGFLSVQRTFPLSREEASQTTQEQFVALVLNAYRHSGDRRAVKHQRQQAVQEAFRSVSPDLLAKVERYVHNDCRLFGYDCSILSRFHLDSPKPRPLFHMDEALVV
ncbi:uncharacterized protein LOC143285885 [Babylonia areolata]|uniref:uncharacterized protein LOC143285885 n=1 Tax=Babylonia areolata TaxID=304850 RepID=UPI003FD23395